MDRDGWLDVTIGCDNINDAMGGVPWSRLYVFRPAGERFADGRFEDVGGTDLVPDFGGFCHDSDRDRASPQVSLRDLDNDGDLDVLAVGPASPGWAPRTEYVGGRSWRNDPSGAGDLLR